MSREAGMKCAKNLFVGAILIFAGDKKLCEVTWDPYFFSLFFTNSFYPII